MLWRDEEEIVNLDNSAFFSVTPRPVFYPVFAQATLLTFRLILRASGAN